jgi:hypothetical protein
VIFGDLQAAEVRNLKAEIERLKKPDECPIPGRENEWRDFQWLFEDSDDGEDEADLTRSKRQQTKQRRPADDDDDSDNGNDTDAASIDGQAHPPPFKNPVSPAHRPITQAQAIFLPPPFVLTGAACLSMSFPRDRGTSGAARTSRPPWARRPCARPSSAPTARNRWCAQPRHACARKPPPPTAPDAAHMA